MNWLTIPSGPDQRVSLTVHSQVHSAGRGFQWERAVFFPDFFHKKMEKFAIFGGSPPFSPSTSLPWLFEPGVEHHPAISPGQNRAADMG